MKRFRECNWTPILVALLLALGIPWMNACTLGRCGDEVVQTIRGEECDQGESNSDTEPDACRTDCTLPSCGDGVVDAGEACDDGNNADGDGCQADCALPPFCGDGILDPDEVCDDGNAVDGDGCAAACECEAVCGDGIVEDRVAECAEQCDDGNETDDDECRNDCTLTSCGNGSLDPGEECDDGNNLDGDGCRANCTLEVCGDGILDQDEACDDGNSLDGDGCESDCTLTPVGTFGITRVSLTPDVNVLGGVRPRFTGDMAIDVVVETNEGMTSVQAEIVSCNPAEVSDCTPVSDTPPSATNWSLRLPGLVGSASGTPITVLVTAEGPGGEVDQQTVDLEVYPVDPGLDVTCTKRYDSGSLYVAFTLVDNGNLPPGYTLADMYDARFWLWQEGQATGFVLDETDSFRGYFALVQPTEFNTDDDGTYEMVFTGLLGFVEPIQANLLIDTIGGPNDVCTLVP